MISYSFYKRVYNFVARYMFKIFFSNKFKYFGKKVSIVAPDIIQGEDNISLYDNVMINSGVWLLSLRKKNRYGNISIGESTYIGRFAHIVSLENITIEKNVLIADKVYISDNTHAYEDINIPIKNQEVIFKKEVLIKENSWIGENVIIIGASIGNHSIIGSNSVVNEDVPDYCIAVGSPAKIIKRYDKRIDKWRKTNKEGVFINEV